MCKDRHSLADRILATIAHLCMLYGLTPTLIIFFLDKTRNEIDALLLLIWTLFFIGPVFPYIIWRRFDNAGNSIDGFQALQATLLMLIVTVMGLVSIFIQQLDIVIFMACLYAIWAAIDTAFGHTFKYMFINRIAASIVDKQFQSES